MVRSAYATPAALPGAEPYEEHAYWRDVGTNESYSCFNAHFETLGAPPRSRMNSPCWPVYASSDPAESAKIASTRQPEPTTERRITPPSDGQRVQVTESEIVVLPAGNFPPRAEATPFLAPQDQNQPDAQAASAMEVVA